MRTLIIGVYYESFVVRYYKYLRAFDDVAPQDEKQMSYYKLFFTDPSIKMALNMLL